MYHSGSKTAFLSYSFFTKSKQLLRKRRYLRSGVCLRAFVTLRAMFLTDNISLIELEAREVCLQPTAISLLSAGESAVCGL